MDKKLMVPLNGLSRLELPEEITKRALSYIESQELLEQDDVKNICERLKNNQIMENRFDNLAGYTFIGALGSVLMGGLSIWLDGFGIFFWSILFGLNVSATAVLHKLSHRAYKQEMVLIREAAREEIEDKLNNYSFLLVGVTDFINAQIELWNLRVCYLNEQLAEPTAADRKRYLELRDTKNDFFKRIQRLKHLYKFKEAEERMAA